MEIPLEDLVQLAKEGHKESLEGLISRIQDRVYGLALRMLGNPADAEDAAQEILIKIITRLNSFRAESKFTSWAFRVATNHLLTTRKRRAEIRAMSFEEHVAWVEREIVADRPTLQPNIEWALVQQEARLLCIQSMLLCLSRPLRIAYILSDVFDLKSQEAAHVLDITPAAYRKRLARARKSLLTFLSNHCHFMNAENRCRCERVAPLAVRAGAIDPEKLVFTQHPCRSREKELPLDYLEQLDSLQRLAALFKSHPDYVAPNTYLETLRDLINKGRVVYFQ
ncbi:MAG: RNA polymerase sigma factor [Myxococcota bacterium]|nr:RNA polymerase sigma factor [Myxococcota bacterium]